MQYLNQLLNTVLKELKAVKYTLGPVANCIRCEKQMMLEYITYNSSIHQSSIGNDLKCPNCAYNEPIDITTTAIKSKVISVIINCINLLPIIRCILLTLRHSVRK